MLEIRAAGTVPSEVVSDVLAMLDVEESMLDAPTEEREDLRVDRRSGCRRGVRPPGGVPGVETAPDPVCASASTTAPVGWRCASAWSAATSPAATPHPASTPPPTSTRTTHPVMQSAEPGEDWRWCYVHHQTA